MTGKFSVRNQEKCSYYARFFKEGSRGYDEVVFWCLFIFVIILLSISSRSFTKSEHFARSLLETEKDLPVERISKIEAKRATQRRMQIKCIAVTSICSLLALIAVILEAFAGFAIQFCHGEDLMHFYWGFWTLIQVGSLIAILGINFSQVYVLTDNKNPPWSVALGTPVLVIAAVAHMIQNAVSATWKEFRGKRKMSKTGNASSAPPTRHSNNLSQSTTIQNASVILIGTSMDNAPLYLMPTRPETLPDDSKVIGSIKGGYIIQHGSGSGPGSPTSSSMPGQASPSEAYMTRAADVRDEKD